MKESHIDCALWSLNNNFKDTSHTSRTKLRSQIKFQFEVAKDCGKSITYLEDLSKVKIIESLEHTLRRTDGSAFKKTTIRKAIEAFKG